MKPRAREGVVNRYSRLGVTRAAGIHNRKVVNIGTYCTRVSNQESRERGFGIKALGGRLKDLNESSSAIS